MTYYMNAKSQYLTRAWPPSYAPLMPETTTTRTLLLPGFGLVTCETHSVHHEGGGAPLTTLRTAVDAKGQRVDPQTWVRIERILGAG